MIEEEKRKTISFYTRIANNSKHPKRAIARHAYIAAHCYLKGIKTTQNDKKALEYFKLAAKNGHTWAKLYCGSMYENGFGVERNLKFARKCYEDAKREKLSLAIIALEAFDTRFPQVK